MIKGILAPKVTGKNLHFTSNTNVRKDNESLTLRQSKVGVSIPLASAQANFMPISKNNISFTGRYDEIKSIKCTTSDNPVIDQTSFLPDKYYQGNAYNEVSDNIVTVLGPDKSVILSHEKDVMSDLVAQDFTKSVLKGKYKDLGFDPKKTRVKVIDFEKLSESDPAVGLTEMFYELGKVKPSEKNVFFIKGYQNLIDLGMELIPAQTPGVKGLISTAIWSDFNLSLDKTLNNPDFLRQNNLHIVGLIPKEFVEKGKKHDDRFIKPPKEEIVMNALKDNVMLPLNGITSDETKALLKKDKRFTDTILRKYTKAGKPLRITPEAIDKIVDKAALAINGAFPTKALQFLDFVATDTVMNKKRVIKPENVENFMVKKGSILDSLQASKGAFSAVEHVKTKLEDVGGLHKVKSELSEFMDFLKDPKKFKENYHYALKGALLTGEPGTGKTLSIAAMAGSSEVPFIAMSGSAFVEKYVGVGAANVRKAFAKAVDLAKASGKKTAVIFIDEVDSVAQKRSSESTHDESKSTLNELLNQMDGLESKNSDVNILVFAATNHKEALDKAFIRAGRFDKTIEYEAPSDKNEVREILNIHTKAKQLNFANEKAKNEILDEISERMINKSGASIEQTVKEAINVMKERVKGLGENPPAEALNITPNDFSEAYMRTSSGGRINLRLDMPVEERETVVAHEAGHAMLQNFFSPERLDFISNQARGEALGVTYYKPLNRNLTKEDVFQMIATSYAGNMSVELKNPGNTGLSSDITNVTKNIDFAIKKGGLGIATPQFNFYADETKQNELIKMYETEIRKDFDIYEKTGKYIANKILNFHKDFIYGDYMDAYRKEAKGCMGGNILSGKEFGKMINDWIAKNNNVNELKALHNHIDEVIKLASVGDLSFLEKDTKMIAQKAILTKSKKSFFSGLKEVAMSMHIL